MHEHTSHVNVPAPYPVRVRTHKEKKTLLDIDSFLLGLNVFLFRESKLQDAILVLAGNVF